MYSTRLMNLLMVALSVSSVTGVAWLDDRRTGLGHHEVKRQDNPLSIATVDTDSTATNTAASATNTDDASTSTSATADSSTTSPSSTTRASSTSTSTANTTPTSTQTTPTSTNNNPTSTATSTTNQPSSSTSVPTGTTTNGGGDGTTSAAPSTTVAPSTSTFVTIITTTDSAGQTVTTSSSSTVVSTPTAAASPSSNSTMTPATRHTIIGVCVGVGGAIVLAAAGVLFWRLRGKRRNHEENEELVSYGDGFGGPGTAEKSEPSGSTATRSPFQSTLESYHAPTQTNAASNF